MVNLICFFITAEFTLFSCLFYSPLIQNSRYYSLQIFSTVELFHFWMSRKFHYYAF
ncbi:hypothetical protein [Wolbachia endosymbiont (group B) of Ennomos erosarius]|uniref:hypothetical protein n=1 Tax=Wolbachia endosymbiont (group B) of Ennomos erosarius TaxID=3066175 RepID=UPI003132DB58